LFIFISIGKSTTSPGDWFVNSLKDTVTDIITGWALNFVSYSPASVTIVTFAEKGIGVASLPLNLTCIFA